MDAHYFSLLYCAPELDVCYGFFNSVLTYNNFPLEDGLVIICYMWKYDFLILDTSLSFLHTTKKTG